MNRDVLPEHGTEAYTTATAGNAQIQRQNDDFNAARIVVLSALVRVYQALLHEITGVFEEEADAYIGTARLLVRVTNFERRGQLSGR